MRHTVRDGVRKLQFDGEMLAHSSSREPGRPRWVEFTLYRTQRGTYVVHRVGLSLIYHAEHCPVVTRNRLSASDGTELHPEYRPCRDCAPSRVSIEGVYAETPRHYAQTSETARGVIGSLMRYDDDGVAYLTNVARKLLEAAAERDPDLSDAFYTEYIE